MIKIFIKKNSKLEISKIVVEGHSKWQPNQENPICSAISAVVLGTINTIQTIHKLKETISVIQKKGYANFQVKKNGQKENLLMLNLTIQLQTISLHYKKEVNLIFE